MIKGYGLISGMNTIRNLESGMAVQILRICLFNEIRKYFYDNSSFPIPHYPLTAPIMMPLVKNRWKNG